MKITDFYPTDWSGKTKTEQRELFDQILAYFTQHELHKTCTRKISHDEWIKKSTQIMQDFAHFYACDLFEDILFFYKLPELKSEVKDIGYLKNENILHRTYAMYDDYFERCKYTGDCKYYNVYTYISCFTAY